jgi:hypothetical protein
LQAVFAGGPLAVIASPFATVILSVSEESRIVAQGRLRRSNLVILARDKLRDLVVGHDWKNKIAASLRSSQ